jgi:hypothetical protein
VAAYDRDTSGRSGWQPRHGARPHIRVTDPHAFVAAVDAYETELKVQPDLQANFLAMLPEYSGLRMFRTDSSNDVISGDKVTLTLTLTLVA